MGGTGSPPQKVILPSQKMAIIASTILGVGVLALPRIATEMADTGAPLATALAALVGLLGLVIMVNLGNRFPDMTIYQYSQLITGRFFGKVFGLLFAGFFAVLTALAAREFGEVVVTVVLKRTPLEVTTVILILLAASATRNNMGTFARIHQFYLPFVVIPSVLIVLLSLKNAHSIYLLPLWGNGVRGLLRGTVLIAALFQGFAVAGITHTYLTNRKLALRAASEGLAIAGFVYVLAVAGALAVFGPQEIRGLMWPTLELAKTTAVPGGIIERLDAPFIIVWVTAVFTTVYSTYMLAAVGVAQCCGVQDHKTFVFPLIPVIYVLALRPSNIEVLYRIISVVGVAGLPLTICWPALLWLIAAVRGLRTGEAA